MKKAVKSKPAGARLSVRLSGGVLHGFHQVEQLEDRVLLSTITWTNRGQTSDGFDSVFGNKAAAARAVLDAVITTWERAIYSFNYPGGGNTYSMNISMAASGTSVGANAKPTHYTSDGKPDQGTMSIGRGGDLGTDGIGDGGGYFLDPTPFDSSEFTDHTNSAFAAYAGAGSSAFNQGDLYEVTLHEMGHAMGLTNSPQMLKFVTKTTTQDTVDSTKAGLATPVGYYYRFDAPGVTTLMTSFDSGGQTGGPVDFGSPDHFAPPGAQVTVNGVTYLGSDDLMTPYYSNGQRRNVSLDDTLVLKSVYGYSMAGADAFGTQYDTLDNSGLLRINTPGNGADQLQISVSGNSLYVILTMGTPVAGADPVMIDSTFSTLASDTPHVSSISIKTNAGDDTILLGPDGIPTTVDGGSGGDDLLELQFVTGVMTIATSGISNPGFQLPSISGINELLINGGPGDDTFGETGAPLETGGTESINGGAGNDILTYSGSAGFDNLPDPHFDGETGSNSIYFDDTNANGDHELDLNNKYLVDAINGPVNSIRSQDFSNVQSVTIASGSGNDDFTPYLTTTAIALTIYGNGGDDIFQDGLSTQGAPASSLPANIAFYGGSGTNTIIIDDQYSNTSAKTYTVGSSSLHTSTGGLISYGNDVEAIYIRGTNNYNDTFNVSGFNYNTLNLSGGTGNDAFNFTGGEQYNTTITGGGGNDSLTLDDRAASAMPFRADIYTQQWDRDYGSAGSYLRFKLDFTGITSPTYYAASAATSTYIYGVTPVPAAYQTTLVLNSGDDNIYYYPHDSSGNLTDNGAIGIIGGGGTNRFYVDDSTSSSGLTYSFSNPYGSGTQNINGMGSAGLGTAQIQYITILAGSGADTFNLNQYTSGVSVTLDGDGGNDTVNFTPSSKDVASYITSLGLFTFDGGPGSDSMNVYNDNSTLPWTYSMQAGYLYISKSSFSLYLYDPNVEYVSSHAGSGNDSFIANYTPPGSQTYFYGNGGTNSYTLDTGATASGSVSSVYIYAGAAGTDSISANRGAFFLIPQSETIASLTIANGSGGAVAPAGPTAQNVLTLSTVNIDAASYFSLSDGAMIVHNGDLTLLTNLLRSGYANGAWYGLGIDSTAAAVDASHLHTLAVLLNNTGGTTRRLSTFDGSSVLSTDVLIKYTYYGDPNFSGKVDGSDYSLLDNGYLNHLTGWANGDLNYDNVINGSDYTLMDNAFNRQSTAVPAAQVATVQHLKLASPAAFAPAVVFSSTPLSGLDKDKEKRLLESCLEI